MYLNFPSGMKTFPFDYQFLISDIDECSSDPCMEGQCHNGVNKYSCVCSPGYTGITCSTGKTAIIGHTYRPAFKFNSPSTVNNWPDGYLCKAVEK